MPFERLCLQGDLPAPGHMRAFALGAHEICIANQAGQLAAFDNLCPHRGAPLAEGSVEAGAVVCPLHAWAF
ncbi:MAG TPA: Rieske 2Fe-2S domain-containing protein, partial [Acidobacteriaceae bacterium]